MIVVEVIKHDAYMNKVTTKTYTSPTEENARTRAEAFASVHKCPAEQIKEERDERGNLLKVVVDCRPPPPGPSAEQKEIEAIKVRLDEIERRLKSLELGGTRFTHTIKAT